MLNKLKPKSEFSRNVLTLMTGTTIAQAIPIAVSPILTRIYTPEDFGVFALFIAIIATFSSVSLMRYEQVIVLVKKEIDIINIFSLGIMILLFFVMFLVVVILLFHDYFVSLIGNKQITNWLYWIPVSLLFTGLFNLLTAYNNRMKYYTDISNATIVKALVMAIIQLCVGFFKDGAVGLVSGQIVSNMFANMKLIKNIFINKNILSNISYMRIKKLAIEYKNFPKFQAPHAFFNTLSSYIPIYLLGLIFNTTIVGFYAMSMRIVLSPLMILAGASSRVYNQQVSELYNRGGNVFEFTSSILLGILKRILLPFIIIIIFSPDIFAFVFGNEWRVAGIYTQILSPFMLLNILVSTIAFIPSIVNMQKKAFYVSVVQVILTIISIGYGVYANNIYISLILYSCVTSLVLLYNMYWMLRIMKELN